MALRNDFKRIVDKLSMKSLFILLTLLIFGAIAKAQNLTGYEYLKDVKPDAVLDFEGQKKSLLDFEDIEVDEWLSYDNWEQEKALQAASPYWEALLRTRRQNEEFGRVLECHGYCIVSKGNSENRIQYRSKLVESDEVRTDKNSFLWLFLIDGTLIRLSPHTSISLNEINISAQKVFFNIRVNQGNIYILSRSRQQLKVQKKRETEQVFFPLAMYEANPKIQKSSITLDDYLFGRETQIIEQYDRANYYLDFNNNFINKNSYYFISMPNASIHGENFSLEAYSAISGDSYFKKRNYGFNKRAGSWAKFNLRGYANTNEVDIVDNTWYKVALPAKSYEEIEPLKSLRINEFLTKRMPSILLARELYLQKFSQELFDPKLKSEIMASKYGYRVWSNNEIKARVKFLVDFTRRLETSNLAVAKRYREKVLEKSSLKDAKALRVDYYEYAIYKYIKSGEQKRDKFFIPKYNSERRDLWKYFNGIR